MRFYTQSHQYYCGVDLHARSMYLCILNAEGDVVMHHNMPSRPEPFLRVLAPYRDDVVVAAERFTDPCVRKSIALDIALIDVYDQHLSQLETDIVRTAKTHDPNTLHLLHTVPGIGKILALVILYEIHTIARFENVGNFLSYARLVKCAKESAGKRYGTSGSKIGYVHLRWAFGEAACLFLRANPDGQKLHQRLANKHGKAKALSILAQKLGRAVYVMLKRKRAFDVNTFLSS